VGQAEARAFKLIKSDAGWKMLRWVEQFGGFKTQQYTGGRNRIIGQDFEKFCQNYLIPGARRLGDKEGVGDYFWRGIYVEVKSGREVPLDQLARVAANAAEQGTGFAYIYLTKPAASVAKAITDKGGVVWYLYE
jgi:hypothetical protein